jgi:hypothetical protein
MLGQTDWAASRNPRAAPLDAIPRSKLVTQFASETGSVPANAMIVAPALRHTMRCVLDLGRAVALSSEMIDPSASSKFQSVAIDLIFSGSAVSYESWHIHAIAWAFPR